MVKRDSDGYTFSLPAKSKELILSKFPNSRPVRNIFVGYEVKSDFETLHGKIQSYIIPALTDLTAANIEQLGGLKLIDAATGNEIGKI